MEKRRGAKVLSGAFRVTFSNHTSLIEWCMVTNGFNNGHQKDKCLQEIKLRALTKLVILGSIMNMIEEEGGGAYMIIYCP